MKLLSKYKKQPEGEELDRLFEEALEDMMLTEEKRKPLRVYSDDRKWLFIQTQMKQNIQGNFTVISTLDILNSVFYSFSSLFIRILFLLTRLLRLLLLFVVLLELKWIFS